MTSAVDTRAHDAPQPTPILRETPSSDTAIRAGDRIVVTSGRCERVDTVMRVIGVRGTLSLVEMRRHGEVVVLLGHEGAEPRVLRVE